MRLRQVRRVRTSTIDRVDDARRRDGELAVAVGHEGRVLEDGLLLAPAGLFEEDLGVGVVRQGKQDVNALGGLSKSTYIGTEDIHILVVNNIDIC